LLVVFNSEGIDVHPPHRLLYYPMLPERIEAPATAFQQGEKYEFRQRDYEVATDWYRELGSSSDAAIRAGAFLRLARNLRKLGRHEAALDAYGELVEIKDVALGGIPADLVALRARCTTLSEMGRTAELRTEATMLRADLRGGRWQLDRASYRHFSEQVNDWLGSSVRPEPVPEALAQAVEGLWHMWQEAAPGQLSSSGRRCSSSDGASVISLWQSGPERLTALVAGPRFQQCRWFSELMNLAGLQISIVSEEGRAVFGSPPNKGARQTRRPASETGLPWTVVVANADPPAALVQFDGRRRLLLVGLGLLTVLVAAGSYFIWRVIARELAAARLQSDFVSAVSHEFRTPLTSLRQFNELLSDDEDLPKEQRRTFYAAQMRATYRLQRLVESLLDFGRMEAGAHPYRHDRVDADVLVQKAVEEFRREVDSKRLVIRCKATQIQVDADAEALSRALWNLLDNAVKYSGESGIIAIQAERRGNLVAISVSDQGPGIPRDEQRDIFRKFVRGAYAQANHIRGTGIGLSMVRHIVEAHGGTIELASAPGTGSTFTILLPVRG
jgi:signal transduction histidine kinase